ncbi:MAG: hypothetical protein UY28_C0004G0038 [Candidatus Amesbacteria bacterium GW2011_GWB1_48_13]|uniref:Uncharacterized protein n=1 Tax=Candidatus Amesbacteria bacterium GW2011_GWB1_48_13 TaxID=1618362 RepID=A0A0G1XVG5_9BACT|nr:MAG: hypothetical protein UY28_C0004G0038 [Candidatus Amesbacteria bacterium GW2011_GWB1_48_13]
MRVYIRIVVDIKSGRVLEADSYEYEGQVAECKGGGGGTTTSTTGLPEWLRPYAEQFIQAYQGEAMPGGVVRPRPETLNQQVAGFTPEQQSAMGGITALTPGYQSVANLGIGQEAATIGGAYLSPETNPWLRKTYEAAAKDVSGTMRGAALRGGAFGSSGAQQAEGRALDELATKIYGGAYEQERQRMMQGLQLLPPTLSAGYYPQQALMGVGAQKQQQGQTEADVAYQNAVAASEYPFSILSGYGGALGQAGSGAGTSTTKTSGGGGGIMGTVICTELYRQGLMDEDTYQADLEFGQTLSPEILAGYHRWAIPLANAMRRSRLVTWLVVPLALAWAKEMQARVTHEGNRSVMGQILLKIGLPICRWLGRDRSLTEMIEMDYERI